MYIRLYEQNYFISKLFMITYDRVLVSGRGWMHRMISPMRPTGYSPKVKASPSAIMR